MADAFNECISILIVDDHPVFREGLRLVLEVLGDFEVIGETGDGETACHLVEQLRPDIVLIDINLPVMNGIDTAQVISTQRPETGVAMITAYDTIEQRYNSLLAGAQAYFYKDVSPEELASRLWSLHTLQVIKSARSEDYYEQNWPVWKSQIDNLLYEKERIGLDALTSIPEDCRVDILRRYLIESGPSKFIPFDHVGDFGISIGLRSASTIRSFLTYWAEAGSAVEYEQTEAFQKHIIGIADCLCDLLGSVGLISEEVEATYRRLHALTIDVSPAVQYTKLSDILPMVFLQRRKLLESDLDEIRHLLTRQMGLAERIALLVLFSSEPDLQEARRLVEEGLRKVYAYDVIALGKEDFQQIIVKKDPQRALRQFILRNVDLIAVSPFVTSGPVPDNMFFGREQELRQITEHASTASYALIGGRRVGKTSILQRLDRVRLPAGGYNTLYFDCQPYLTSKEFLRAAYQRWMKERLPGDLVPPSFTDIVDYFAGDEPLTILLDEIDRLAMNDAAEGSPLFSTFRALSQSGQCQFVICGERALRSKLRDADSPLFNFCNEMLIGMLDYRAVEELVTKPFKQLEMELVKEQELVQRIYAFSSGHPNIVQRLCQRLVEQLNERQTRQLTVKDVDIVVSDPKFQRDSRDIFWERATVLEKLISLVMVEDQSCCSVEGVRQALARHGVQANFRQVDDALERLVDLRSILRRTVEGYEFAVTAFPRMLSRTTTIHNAIEYQKEVFEEIGDEVEI